MCFKHFIFEVIQLQYFFYVDGNQCKWFQNAVQLRKRMYNLIVATLPNFFSDYLKLLAHLNVIKMGSNVAVRC